MGLWFEMGDPIELRRVDLNVTYPSNLFDGSRQGQIWSSALMKIWGDLGRDVTDQLFLETHFLWGQSPSMRDAAAAFMQADINLYDGEHLCEIVARFKEHGLIEPPTLSEILTQNTIWDEPVFVMNSLIIPNGLTLTINSMVRCEPNVSITVRPGGKLIVDGGTLTSACSDQMWKGIIVEGNSLLSQTAANQGTVELKNGAVLENSVVGITAAKGSGQLYVIRQAASSRLRKLLLEITKRQLNSSLTCGQPAVYN
ncbi:hypothetical protein LJC68_10025 [Bacteroidales bacterium OttesenSCG-928-B11]|nr:hypothetical protein [Bacteroidales bacterium OttesenSCG-928-E04]MDL2313197.1 hypothetical protein [Bacteroidales bacterium OttesenSCG-928-B11]MDL2326907.1 hypothetical protein [Bacteroidales bacterium OttesenSCG-928-A14]